MSDRDQAILWARQLLAEDFVVLDTETTGLGSDDEAVSIALIDKSGAVLLDTLLRHTKRSEPGALAVHGHSWEATRSGRAFAEVWPLLAEMIRHNLLVIYNADFDCRMIGQMIRRYEIDARPVFRPDAECAMDAFAKFYGDWSDWTSSYRWQQLTKAARHFDLDTGGAHGAAADCLLTLGVVRGMAETLTSEELRALNE